MTLGSIARCFFAYHEIALPDTGYIEKHLCRMDRGPCPFDNSRAPSRFPWRPGVGVELRHLWMRLDARAGVLCPIVHIGMGPF